MHFVIFQHLDVEHPGVFAEAWRQMDIELTTVGLGAGEPVPSSLDRFDAMVVMGGPMDVWETGAHPWLAPELAAIRRAVAERSMPFLGVCLGHQLLAAALGGAVRPACHPEVGLGTIRLTGAAAGDPLLAGLLPAQRVFQWHSSEVAELPAGAVLTATSDACGVQAFRWGPRAFGVQFHAEVTEAMIAGWADIPAYRRSLEQMFGPGGVERLRRDFATLAPSLRDCALHLARDFARLVPAPRPRRGPPLRQRLDLQRRAPGD